MMSLRPVNAGSGYEYLLRSVATNDASDSKAPSLSSYYQAKGTPPGRWLGSGLTGLGSEAIIRGSVISELHMGALYGEGLHPETDDKIANGQTLSDCRIGRAFPIYTNNDPVLMALNEAEREFKAREKRLPSEVERTELMVEVATPFYQEAFAMDPPRTKDLVTWVNAKKDKVRQAVAGYDFTFSPTKSISMLWALSDEQTASAIAACHHRAVSQALEWAEKEVIRTRQGAGGKKQVKTRGLIAAEFTHFDTRAGDPDLHSHVLVSNKVQDEDGGWKALDGRTIFRFHQTIGMRYNVLVKDELSRTLGIDFEPHSMGDNKQPVWEVANFPREVIEHFSKRRANAQPVYERKVEKYVEKTGAIPSKRIKNELWQQAILETRDAKKPAQSLAELREQWREEMSTLPKAEKLWNRINKTLEQGEFLRPSYNAEAHEQTLAIKSIELVTQRRSVFRRSHLITVVETLLNAYRFESPEKFTEVQEHLVNKVLADFGIALNSQEQAVLPERLVNEDGHGIDRLLDADLFTTTAIIAAEQAVLEAVDEPTAAVVSDRVVSDILVQHKQEKGWTLNAGQQQLAHHLLTSGTLVATGVGPAGTGKTASMDVVTKAWQKEGRKVIGLAPSAAAADVLSKDIGIQTHTIDSLTFTWRGLNPNKPGSDLRSLGVDINPGDMLLVDEAGMASTTNLAALVDIAKASGAVVRLVGDHKQLSAVENGGLFGALVRAKPTAELTHVMRFGDDNEQAAASMKLRNGDVEGLQLYEERGWVHAGTRKNMLTQAANAYLADIARGQRGLVLAGTNEDVEFLNSYIRDHLISHNVIDPTRSVEIGGDQRAAVGDKVIARKNKRFSLERDGVVGKVINGDMFTVTGFTDNGDLVVKRDNGNEQVLPANYIAENVRLGYASTVHRAQGATVDITRAVIDSRTDQAGFYVAVTRGKFANHVYTVTDVALDFEAEDAHYHYQGEGNPPTAREVLERVVTNDARDKSALETMWDEAAEATSPERIKGLWLYGRDLILDEIVNEELPRYLATLPANCAQQLRESEDGDTPIRSAWKELLRAGRNPADYMDEVLDGIEQAHDVARLMTYRLKLHLPSSPSDTEVLPFMPSYIEPDLREWMKANVPAKAPVRKSESSTTPRAPRFGVGTVVEGQDFSGVDFTGVDLTKVTFSHCDFNGAVFNESQLTRVKFVGCQLNKTSFADATLVASSFNRCQMEQAVFDRATFGEEKTTLTRTLISNCQATWTSFRDSVLYAVEIAATTLAHADFSGALVKLMRAERSDMTGFITSENTSGWDNLQSVDTQGLDSGAQEKESPAPAEPVQDGVEEAQTPMEF